MERAGVDIISDGEARRESYSNRFATALDGIDTVQPGTTLELPTVRQVKLDAVHGRIEFDGADMTHETPDRRIQRGLAYVPQGREIFPRLTVEENLHMGLATQANRASVPARVFEMFPVLKQMLGRKGGDLSGGQQQQLAIGRALAMQPRLLILDEPTEGIQPSIVLEIEEAIRRIRSEMGLAVLLVEQYLDFAERLADAYVIMAKGTVVAGGPTAQLHLETVRHHLAV